MLSTDRYRDGRFRSISLARTHTIYRNCGEGPEKCGSPCDLSCAQVVRTVARAQSLDVLRQSRTSPLMAVDNFVDFFQRVRYS